MEATHQLDVTGEHQVTVTVTDDDGASASAIVTVLAINPENLPSATTWGLALTAAMLGAGYWWTRRGQPV